MFVFPKQLMLLVEIRDLNFTNISAKFHEIRFLPVDEISENLHKFSGKFYIFYALDIALLTLSFLWRGGVLFYNLLKDSGFDSYVLHHFIFFASVTYGTHNTFQTRDLL